MEASKKVATAKKNKGLGEKEFTLLNSINLLDIQLRDKLLASYNAKINGKNPEKNILIEESEDCDPILGCEVDTMLNSELEYESK